MKILLIEDDFMIGEAISHALRKDSHSVNWVTEGDVALETLSIEEYSLVLLDLGLPIHSGFEVLNSIRNGKLQMPIIIITACDSVQDRVKGLDAGADDYLVKPFSLEELNARIRAVTRRNEHRFTNVLSTGPLKLNIDCKSVSYDGAEIVLTAKEYQILFELMNRPGVIFSREKLESKLYGWDEEISSNAVEFLIHNIRKKISKDTIKNIRGLGWMIPKN